MISILLALVAFLLAGLIFPIALVYSFFKNILYYKGKNFFLKIGLSIDIIGNTLCEQLFNDFLIVKDGYRFGDSRETISSVLGKNKKKNTLSKLGQLLASTLDTIDSNHCINSIKDI